MNIGERSEQAICYAAQRIADRVSDMVCNMDRPSVRYRPVLSCDEGKWVALYGDNLQSGVIGVGESPDEAMFHFDNAWYKRIAETR